MHRADENSTVSVIIPTYNRLPLIQRALASVLAQTYSPKEIIVVDDGSTDNTSEVLRREFRAVTLITQNNRGVSAARNRGILRATGTWVAFLDSDDTWHPDKLARQIEALCQQPDLPLCHCNEIWIRHGRRVNAMDKHAKSGGWIYPACLPMCAISPSAAIMRRSLFDEIGLFDESLPACEDYDLWLRLCSRTPVLYLADKLVTKYGGHSDQLSRQYWGMDRFRIAALERMAESTHLRPEDRQATLEVLCNKIRVYLGGARKRQKHQDIEIYQSKLQRWEGADVI